MAEALRTDHEALAKVCSLPAQLLEELATDTHDVRPDEVARARRHVDEGLWREGSVAIAIAKELLHLSA
jgi:hypothetical protein